MNNKLGPVLVVVLVAAMAFASLRFAPLRPCGYVYGTVLGTADNLCGGFSPYIDPFKPAVFQYQIATWYDGYTEGFLMAPFCPPVPPPPPP